MASIHGNDVRDDVLVLPPDDLSDDRERLFASGSITFVGTATTLIRYAGFTVLTDPNFLHRGERVYLGKGRWTTRRTDPAIEIGDLPDLDLVVLSHLHGDHFDRVAREGLDRSVPVATTPAAAR